MKRKEEKEMEERRGVVKERERWNENDEKRREKKERRGRCLKKGQ